MKFKTVVSLTTLLILYFFTSSVSAVVPSNALYPSDYLYPGDGLHNDPANNGSNTWSTAVGMMGIIVLIIFIKLLLGASNGSIGIGALVNASIGLMVLMLIVNVGYGILSMISDTI